MSYTSKVLNAVNMTCDSALQKHSVSHGSLKFGLVCMLTLHGRQQAETC